MSFRPAWAMLQNLVQSVIPKSSNQDDEGSIVNKKTHDELESKRPEGHKAYLINTKYLRHSKEYKVKVIFYTSHFDGDEV